jgi:hypothetical protein
MAITTANTGTYTGPAGNTWYYGSKTVKSESGNAARNGRVVGLDLGSDGTVDHLAGRTVGARGLNDGEPGVDAVRGSFGYVGPNGAATFEAGRGPNRSGASLMLTNGDLERTWSSYGAQ